MFFLKKLFKNKKSVLIKRINANKLKKGDLFRYNRFDLGSSISLKEKLVLKDLECISITSFFENRGFKNRIKMLKIQVIDSLNKKHTIKISPNKKVTLIIQS